MQCKCGGMIHGRAHKRADGRIVRVKECSACKRRHTITLPVRPSQRELDAQLEFYSMQ